MNRWTRSVESAIEGALAAEPRQPYDRRMRREMLWSLALGPVARPWAAVRTVRLLAAWTVAEARRAGLDPATDATRAALTAALADHVAEVLCPGRGLVGRIRPGLAIGMGQEMIWVPRVVAGTLSDAVRRLQEVA